ncbi:hypothetical protein CYMTET_27160 [Cymbomonas tetramitiformis]|uniref:REJ domain-containing protein n=1 Tax=Cymbomonas tetramitiformis TaxID=36881 RepID=A0AAE0FQT0_9CHLO|nr:hypothetical protein CYMTET_27160 [Cymbomonas tetramitiformis]
MVTMTSGALPVPAIAALPGKVNMNDKMTLTSAVESTAPEALARAWTVFPEEGTDPLDLAAAAATALTTADLVVRAGTLMCGGAYIFRLAVEDSVGLASTSMRVVVNSPPSSGALTVTPAEGIVLETLFQASATDWQDEDAPLWYQLKYEVVGAGGGLEMLTEYQPQPTAETMLAEEGLSAHDGAVLVYVLVRDALGAVATSAGVTVAVNPVIVEGSELTAYVDNMVDLGATSMANGNTDEAMLLVDGMAKTMNVAAERRRRRRRRRVLLQEVTDQEAEAEDAEAVGKAQEQRQGMLDILGSAQHAVAASDSSLQRLASSASNVVTEPEETGGLQQDAAFGILGGIVAEAENPASDASISTDTSDALGNGLSSLVVAGVVNPSSDPAAPNPAARGLGTLSAMAGTLAAGMVTGEDAATMASDVLTMRTQQEDLSDPNSGAFAAPLDTPGGLSSVSFPASLGKELARRRRNLMSETGGSTVINLFTSTVDPHANLTADSNATRALRRALLQALDEDDEAAPEAASVSAVVTSIGLTTGGGEVAVSGLEVGITFTLPLVEGGAGEGGGNRSAPPQCAFYDEVNATYSREGCGSLPTPAPPGVRLQWRTLNVSEAEGHIERMWEVENTSSSSWFLNGCEESFEAAYPEYLGTDAGLRKYLGEGCAAADPENNASCWWEWESQAFVGAGCEWGSHVHCLCTHLTDFKATQDQELGSAEPPKGSFISAEDMTALSPGDLMKSALLLGILGGLMGGALLLAQLSDYVHTTEKEGVFRELLKSHGTEHLWFKYAAGSVWTWSLTLEERYGTGAKLSVVKLGSPPGAAPIGLRATAGIAEKGGEVEARRPLAVEAAADPRGRRESLESQSFLMDWNGRSSVTAPQASRSLVAASEGAVKWQGQGQPVTEAYDIFKSVENDQEDLKEIKSGRREMKKREIEKSRVPTRVHSVAAVGPLGSARSACNPTKRGMLPLPDTLLHLLGDDMASSPDALSPATLYGDTISHHSITLINFAPQPPPDQIGWKHRTSV